jgi:hypothetical protein
MDARLVRWSSSAGIWIGAFAWAVSTQLNYALVPWICASGVRVVPWTAAALALLSLAGTALSAMAFRDRAARLETGTPRAGTPYQMLAVIGVLSGVLFALVIALQGTASFFLTGCEP